jgi:hypothetical protein
MTDNDDCKVVEKQRKCHSIHHTSHVTEPGLEPGVSAAKRLSCDTAYLKVSHNSALLKLLVN